MALNKSIFTALSADAGVLAALGVTVAPFPIYLARTPDGPLPALFVVYSQIIGQIDATQNNDSGQFMDALYQFSCYGATHAAARAVRLAISNAFTALDAVGLAGGEKFVLEAERDLFEPVSEAHHLILEVRFFCNPLAA